MHLPTLNRTCGTCTACCFAPILDELRKPAFQDCQFKGNGCCTNYDARPPSCRRFNCLYIEGRVDTRPNETGLLLVRHGGAHGVIVAFETREGAWEENKSIVRRMIKNYRGIGRVVLYRFGAKIGIKFDPGEDYQDRGETGLQREPEMSMIESAVLAIYG